MAKGFEENRKRVAELNSFGKDLARRARSKCELCESAGVPLAIFEVAPVEHQPQVDRCVFICASCAEQVGDARRFKAGEHWRCLAKTVWSEVPALQVLAVRALRRQEATQAWARDTLESIYLDDEVEAWADAAD